MLYLSNILQEVTRTTPEKVGKDLTLMWDNGARNCLFNWGEDFFAGISAEKGCTKLTNVVAIEDNYDVSKAQRLGKLFFKQKIFDTNGVFLGEVKDVALTKNLRLVSLVTEDENFKRGEIAAVGDAVLIKRPSYKKILTQKALEQKRENALSKANESQTQNVQTQETSQSDALHPNPPKPKNYGVHQIRKHYGDFNFLIGKTVDKNIVNFQGELMLKKGENITKDILRQAKVSGKLIELYLHIE